MSWLKYNKKYQRYYIIDTSGKCVRSLGKINREQAEQELNFFKKQNGNQTHLPDYRDRPTLADNQKKTNDEGGRALQG